MKRCDKFGELLSSAIDGELSKDEVSRLDDHLVECDDCRHQLDRFKEIDRLATSPRVPMATIGKLASVKKPIAASRRSIHPWLGVLGIAALILISFTISALLQQGGDGEDQFQQRLSNLKVINERIAENQLDTLKTMEMELRVLNLEVASSDLDPDQAIQLKEHIRALMKKVETSGK